MDLDLFHTLNNAGKNLQTPPKNFTVSTLPLVLAASLAAGQFCRLSIDNFSQSRLDSRKLTNQDYHGLGVEFNLGISLGSSPAAILRKDCRLNKTCCRAKVLHTIKMYGVYCA